MSEWEDRALRGRRITLHIERNRAYTRGEWLRQRDSVLPGFGGTTTPRGLSIWGKSEGTKSTRTGNRLRNRAIL